MNYSDFTLITQEALKEGSEIAKQFNHQFLENGHVLQGILLVDKSVAPFILKRMDIDLDQFKQIVSDLVDNYPSLADNVSMQVSAHVNKSLRRAQNISKDLGDQYVSIEHIFVGILLTGDVVSELMKTKGISKEKLETAIQELRKGVKVDRTNKEKYEYLKLYASNLTEQASTGKLDPIIGRNEEIRRILQIISRRRKNNPVIIGDPGVGKTAIVEGLAQRIVRGDVPENMKENIIFSLDMGALVAGASKQGEFEERLKHVVREVEESNGEVMLFIDEIHLLVGAGKGAGAMDAANILKPALARGDLRTIGATTLTEYQKYFEKDKALERRFLKVLIEEPSTEDTISILRGIKEKYENFHKVMIKDEAVVAAVELSQRYVGDRSLPDKAVDVIDEAASKLRLEMNSLPDEIDVVERGIRQLKLEKVSLKKEDNQKGIDLLNEKIANLSDERSKLRAIWQSEKAIINDITETRAELEQLQRNLRKHEEEANYEKVAELEMATIPALREKLVKLQEELANNQTEVVLSKDSVDRDLVAEVIAAWTGIPLQKMAASERDKLIDLENELRKRVIGQDEAIVAVADAIRRSRTGLQDENKPIGSFIFLGTTGVGKTELAKALAQLLFDDEQSMTRIDMSEYQEKHSVSRLIGSPPGYVGYDEGGQLTEAVRLHPYSVVLFDEIEKAHKDVFYTLLQVLDDGRLTDSKGRTVNFKNTIIIMTSNAGSDKILEIFKQITKDNVANIIKKAKQEVSQVLKEKMAPEFLNRIDEIIMFRPLNYQSIKAIAELQLNSLRKKLKKRNIEIYCSRMAKAWIARMGYNPQFGARPVKRTIQRYINTELAKKILKGEIVNDKIILVDYDKTKLKFSNFAPSELEQFKIDEAKLSEKKQQEIKVIQTDETTTTKLTFWQRLKNWFTPKKE